MGQYEEWERGKKCAAARAAKATAIDAATAAGPLTLSVDAETNGLYGEVIAIGAVLCGPDGVELDYFSDVRVSDPSKLDPWVRENVYPRIKNMLSRNDYGDMLDGFWRWWLKYRPLKPQVIAHIGSPVESGLFRRCIEVNMEGRQFNGPFPLHEVGTALLLRGHDPLSVDRYAESQGLPLPEGQPHDPLYDARVAALVWRHLAAT